MAKKEKVRETAPLRRRMVLVTETDLRGMKEAFAEGREAVVTVHAVPRRELTESERARRRAYRQKPEVRERVKVYRKQRAVKQRAVIAQAQAKEAPAVGV